MTRPHAGISRADLRAATGSEPLLAIERHVVVEDDGFRGALATEVGRHGVAQVAAAQPSATEVGDLGRDGLARHVSGGDDPNFE